MLKWLKRFRFFNEPIAKKAILFADADQYVSFSNIDLKKFDQIQVVTCSPHCTRHVQAAMRKNSAIQFTSLDAHNQVFQGKETTDKYIAIQLQKLITAGYTSFGIMSADADYYSIVNMLIMSNPEFDLKFTLYVSTKYHIDKHERLKSTVNTVYI